MKVYTETNGEWSNKELPKGIKAEKLGDIWHINYKDVTTHTPSEAEVYNLAVQMIRIDSECQDCG